MHLNPEEILYYLHRNNIEGIKKHLEQGLDPSYKIDGIVSLLHIATRLGHTEIVELLIAYNADVNSTDSQGNTPLHYAAWLNDEKIVKLLIEANASITLANNDDMTPLQLASPQLVESLNKSEVYEKSDEVNECADYNNDSFDQYAFYNLVTEIGLLNDAF